MWHQQRGYPPAQGVNAQHSSMPNAPRFPYQPPRMAPPASQPVAPSAPSPGSQKQRVRFFMNYVLSLFISMNLVSLLCL